MLFQPHPQINFRWPNGRVSKANALNLADAKFFA